MSTGKGTHERPQRPPLGAQAPEMAPRATRFATLLFAALLALTLTLAPRAEAYVYWANPGTGAIGRANLDNSGVDHSFITVAGTPLGVAVNSTHVYWVNDDTSTIGRARLDGTGANQDFIANVEVSFGAGLVGEAARALAVDDAHIYWVSKFTDWSELPPPGDFGAITRANVDGADVDENFITGLDYPDGPVAVGGSHVYWTSYSFAPLDLYSFPDRVGRANLDGTGVEESFIAANGVNGVAVDDAHVWDAASERFDGAISRTNLDGTGRETVINPGGEDFFPDGVAVSDTHVYWRGGYGTTGGSIGRAKLDGRQVKHRFITGTGGGLGSGLAVDELPFTFGKLKRDRKHGTAKLTVNVPGPGELALARTKKIKGVEKRAEAEGRVKLPVKPSRKAKQKLAQKGKAKVKARVTYTPDGGEPNAQTKQLRLIKRR